MQKNITRTYRMDAISVAYLENMKAKTGDGHSDLIRQAVSYYANYVLGHEDVRNIQLELLFNSPPLSK